ncbi:MAG TPA: hypothetical protein VG871_13895 [Vicinamibacterales bacterium]|nr:hypothetical protein [Vicinamibacterales bacterium]
MNARALTVVLGVSLSIAAAHVDVVAGQARPAAAQSARAMAPVDLTGTWVSIVSEDWRWRMVTPPKGDVASVPVNAEGRRAAAAWDRAADIAANNQCRAFGVGGLMRQPGRIRISWQDDNTLKMEFDAGTQTRLLHFALPRGQGAPSGSRGDRSARSPAQKTWQGFSVATWEGPGVGRGAGPVGDRVRAGGLPGVTDVPGGGGNGLRGSPPPRQEERINSGGDLKIVTTGFREGYLRKNGVPYSEQASITEYVHRLPTHPNGDVWLEVITIVEDPQYLSQPFYTSTNFRLEPNDAKFSPRPCDTPPPLPIKSGTPK